MDTFRNNPLGSILNFMKANVPLIGLLIIILLLAILSPAFLTLLNILNVLRQASINGFQAFGLTLVIISGGIDLSVGSIVAFSGMVSALLILAGVTPILAVLAGLVSGTAIGVLNGLLISKGKLQPFIATLGSMMVFRGLTLYISNGVPASKLGEGLIGFIGRGFVLGIPTPVYLLLLIFAVIAFVLRKTVFGKRIYAIGGNKRAAFLSGIDVDKNLVYVYAISGFLAALAGIVLMSRVDSAVPTAGIGFELSAIAAAVIGGLSLAGGKGKASGTLIGILIIAIIINGLNLLGTSSYLQQVITGLIIVAAVIADRKK
jgi:ribose transport system permease protein